jgi:hypothetical protein
MISMPFMAIVGLLMDSSDDPSTITAIVAVVLAFILPFVYPAILAWRVRRMAQESRVYTESGKPPVWG